jgi:hypothetical protein
VAANDADIRFRFKQVRVAARLTQPELVPRLQAAAVQLYGAQAPRYTQTRISDIERDARRIRLEDVAVYAAVDPLRRGKLWLGWNERTDSALLPLAPTLPRLRGRSVTEQLAAQEAEKPRRRRDGGEKSA